MGVIAIMTLLSVCFFILGMWIGLQRGWIIWSIYAILVADSLGYAIAIWVLDPSVRTNPRYDDLLPGLVYTVFWFGLLRMGIGSRTDPNRALLFVVRMVSPTVLAGTMLAIIIAWGLF